MRTAARLARTHLLVVYRALRTGRLHGERLTEHEWSIREECLRAWIGRQPCGHDGAVPAAGGAAPAGNDALPAPDGSPAGPAPASG